VAETGPSYTSTHAWRNAAKNAKLELRLTLVARHNGIEQFGPSPILIRS
jgi:hypothetical protein